MAASDERDHSIVHLDRERYEAEPGDYYDAKASNASVLREALALAESKGDRAAVARIRAALERAEYVGD